MSASWRTLLWQGAVKSGCGMNARAPVERMQTDEQGHRAKRKRQPDGCAEEKCEGGEILGNHDACGEGEGFVFYEPEPFCEIRVVAVLQADESHVPQRHGEHAHNVEYGQCRPSDPARVATVCHAANMASRRFKSEHWSRLSVSCLRVGERIMAALPVPHSSEAKERGNVPGDVLTQDGVLSSLSGFRFAVAAT